MVAATKARQLALVAGMFAFACKVYDTSLLEGDTSAVPEDQWGGGIGWWSSKKPNGCISAGVPTVNDRPPNAGGDPIEPLYFAVRDMALGSLDRNGEPTENAWQTLGFDLDGLCTLSTSPGCEGSEQVSCTSQGAGIPFDGLSCRDNTFGRMEDTAVSLPGIGKSFGLSNDGFNCSLCAGLYNFVIKLSEWNGQPDDSNVRIDMYPSPGLETPLGWTCDINAPLGAWKTNACWARTDKWTIQKDSFDGTLEAGKPLPPAKLNDPSAYVRSGYIVAQLPADTLLWFPGDTAVRAFPLKIQQGIVVGKLMKKEDGSWRIDDGTIAGRSRGDDLIAGFEALGFCEGHQYYNTAKFQVSSTLDILASGANSPEATCDAMSTGIGFTADETSFSLTPADIVPLPGCPATTDGGSDSGPDATGGTGGSGGTTTDAGPDASLDASGD